MTCLCEGVSLSKCVALLSLGNLVLLLDRFWTWFRILVAAE